METEDEEVPSDPAPQLSNATKHGISTWEQEIAIPAEQANEGRRLLIDTKLAEVSYEIAPLRDGWAVKVYCGYRSGDRHSVTVPWHRFASRGECLASVLEQAKIHFKYEVFLPSQKRAQKTVLGTLASLHEIEEANLVKVAPKRTHVAKLAEEKPSPGLLF